MRGSMDVRKTADADAGFLAIFLVFAFVTVAVVVGFVVPASRVTAEVEAAWGAVNQTASLLDASAPEGIEVPSGFTWLMGPGRFPRGLDAEQAWPLRGWLQQRLDRTLVVAADPWGQALAVVPSGRGGPVLVVSAGPDGTIQSDPTTGIRGDDVGLLIR
jgi:hypothetical protein